VSGTAGTGKTSLAAHFADAACSRGERCLFLAFEESQGQIVRNMRSIGIDLDRWLQNGLLRYRANRPSTFGLEMHLALVHRLVSEFQPQVVILDPMSTILHAGSTHDASIMLVRLIDYLKVKGVTTLMTSLTPAGSPLEQTEADISSIVDTWLLLRAAEQDNERHHALYVLKSRGMAHSKQLRPYAIDEGGLRLTAEKPGPANGRGSRRPERNGPRVATKTNSGKKPRISR
jgi:circadian clock protein KaiC